jgi:hypothetical protein
MWLFSATSRGFGYGCQAVRIRVKMSLLIYCNIFLLRTCSMLWKSSCATSSVEDCRESDTFRESELELDSLNLDRGNFTENWNKVNTWVYVQILLQNCTNNNKFTTEIYNTELRCSRTYPEPKTLVVFKSATIVTALTRQKFLTLEDDHLTWAC